MKKEERQERQKERLLKLIQDGYPDHDVMERIVVNDGIDDIGDTLALYVYREALEASEEYSSLDVLIDRIKAAIEDLNSLLSYLCMRPHVRHKKENK